MSGGAEGKVLAGYRNHMVRRGLTPSSIDTISRQLRTLADWLPCHIADATPEQIERFLDARRNRNGSRIVARTRYSYLSGFHAFYQWAVKNGFASADPTLDIDRPKLRVGVPRPVTDADKNLAISNAPRDIAAMLTLASYCGGMRVGEIAGLTRDAILEDLGKVRIMGKGQKERVVPLAPVVLRALRAYGMPRAGHIFRRPMGGAFTGAQVSRYLCEYLYGVGVDATPHQFRHWFGTRTYAECKDLLVVAQLMGHASTTTSAIYVAFSHTAGTDAVLALPGAA